MREGNTDVRYSFTAMLDSVGDLFGGRLTLKELLDMDMPFMRALVKSRLENLSKRKTPSNQDFEKMLKDYIP